MQRLALIALASVTCLMSQARATPPDSQVPIATDLSFIEKQVSKTLASLTLLGFPTPTSGYPVSGGDSGTWTTTNPSSGSQGWASGFSRASFGFSIRRQGRRSGLTRRKLGPRPSPSRPR